MKSHALTILFVSSLAAASFAQAPDLYDVSKLRTIELTFKQADYWAQMTNNYPNKVYIKADMKIDGVELKDVGVRFRGNSSYWGIGSSKKKPFEIATDEFVDQRIWGYKTLNLNNNYVDPSFVREVYGYGIMRKFTPAPKSNYVVLKLNGQNWGPYINTQQVNKDFLEEWFPSKDGNRYRAERPDNATPPNFTAFNWLTANLAEYMKGFELKSELSANPWVDLRDTADLVDNKPLATRVLDLPKKLDIDNTLTVLALGNTLLWLDSYVGIACHNYYLYHEEIHDRLHLIPWDLNSCLGSYNDFQTTPLASLSPFYVNTMIGNKRPLMTNILEHPAWKQRFIAKIRRFKDELDWTVTARGEIGRLQNLIEAEVLRDPHRLYSANSFRDNITKDIDLGSNFIIRSIQSMMAGRYAYLSAHPDVSKIAVRVSDLRRNPVKPSANDTVTITAKAPYASTVTLFWRTRGVYNETPMFDDGKHGDGLAYDGVWGAAIPPQRVGTKIEYHVGAATASGIWTGWHNYGNGYAKPSYSIEFLTRASKVLINEFVASNATGAQDEKFQFEDWIELINTDTQPIDVGGMFLSDNLGAPLKWKFPPNTVIPAGGTILVWADRDLTDGPLHADFKLSAGGEEICLIDPTAAYLLDYVEFGAQATDISTGRFFDGGSPWMTFPRPTPKAANSPAGCGFRLYSALAPTVNEISLDLSASPKIASTPSFQFAKGTANSVFILFLHPSHGHLPLPLGPTWLLGLTSPIPFGVPSDATGAAALPWRIPDLTSLVGAKIYWQSLGFAGARLMASNGLEMTICPK